MNIFYEGIVLKIFYFKEDDRIIKIFTQNGVITVIGKSIKKGKRANILDIGNFIRFNIVKGKSLSILTSVSLIDSFYNIKEKNPFSIFYICEVLLKIQREDQDESNIFNMLLYVLYQLKNYNDLALLFFNLRFLKIEGSLINLDKCFICKRELLKDLSFSHNGISHSKCFKGSSISLDVLSLLRNISISKELNMSFNIDKKDIKSALSISILLVENFLEYKIKSKEYII